jgi:site-specific DNA recombinase
VSRRHLAAVPEKPQRVVLYVRVSALMGRGGDDFHSPDIQVGAMRRITAGLQVVDVIEDDIDQTGRTFEREGLGRIRQLAEAGAIDAMAVYNVARFGRNTLEGLQFLNWLADRGVTIISATEHIDTSTPAGRWMLTNMLAIAEMRSDEIGAEWSRTIARRAESGKPHGRAPVGYQRKKDGTLRPSKDAAAITKAFGDYADGGQVTRIQAELRAATGLAWHRSTLKDVFAKRVYLGLVVSKGAHGLVEVQGAHKPLVDQETWERAQARMARDRRMPSRLVEPKYALSGLGRCGECGGHTNHVRASRSNVVLVCSAKRDRQGCAGCGGPRAEYVEAAVLKRVAAYLEELKGDVGGRAAAEAKKNRARLDAGTVDGELKATRRAMVRATERWARGQLEDRIYETTMTSLRADEARLAVALAEARSQAELPEPGVLVVLGERLLQLWPQMSGSQRNAALRELLRTVTIHRAVGRQAVDERIAIDWL